MTSGGDDKLGDVVRCHTCLKDISLSVAKTFEGLDYVHHFCGLDCLEKWRAQVEGRDSSGATPGKH